jgi:shikimate dehydrogenase
MDAQTQLYGIFGSPVSHSLSPLIHNTVFQKKNINAVYLAFTIKQERLGLAFEAMRSLGIRGVNVTVPFKELATQFVDEIPEDVDRCVGAINTVVNRDGKLFGYNTDGFGFWTALKEELSFNPQGRTVLVLGAGGAARGVVAALAQADARKITIYNRTRERGQGLKEYMSGHFPEVEIESLEVPDWAGLEKIDLVVNATSCGMKQTDPAPIDLRRLQSKPAVYDLIYSPAQTQLLKDARSLGLSYANGLGMLAAQAALSFGIWTGQKEGVRELMMEALKTCRL